MKKLMAGRREKTRGAGAMSRRLFLRGAGVGLALPLLESLEPKAWAAAAANPPRRMLFINTALGLHGPSFFPKGTGVDYAASPYLEILRDFRSDFSVFSGLSHPHVAGGHATESSFLTAAPHPNRDGFINTISLDQLVAERLSSETRFDFLALGIGRYSLSWTRDGVPIPPLTRPSEIFARLFVEGTREEQARSLRALDQGRSVLDAVRERAKRLSRKLSAGDRDNLDQYFTSVRGLEERLARRKAWALKPKPKVEAEPPRDITDPADISGRTRLMLDLAHLALQTDSTRVITLFQEGNFLVPPIDGVDMDWHLLSHHGHDPKRLKQLQRVELEQMRLLRGLLAKLAETPDSGGRLLDRSMVLFGSNLGNASSHDARNLPILLAGGGFKHGSHLAFDARNNTPLCNLFLSMLQRMGLETERFASSSGTLNGLELEAG